MIPQMEKGADDVRVLRLTPGVSLSPPLAAPPPCANGEPARAVPVATDNNPRAAKLCQ
jgi:hypothetical protein